MSAVVGSTDVEEAETVDKLKQQHEAQRHNDLLYAFIKNCR